MSAALTRYRVSGMDCAACAGSVEQAVSELGGVRAARVSFGAATLEVEGPVAPELVLRVVATSGYRARPAVERESEELVPFWRRSGRAAATVIAAALLLAATVASVAGADGVLPSGLYVSALVVGGAGIARTAVNSLRRRRLDMNVLMALAAVGAVAIGDLAEASWVLVLFAVGTTLESFALDRTRRSIEALGRLLPDEATLLEEGGERVVPLEEVPIGAEIAVRPGERVPLDGVIVSGSSGVDESPVTGESIPVDKSRGEQLFAGSLNGEGALVVRVTHEAGDSTIQRIARLVEQAQASRAPSERFVDRFAAVYTPLVLAGALLVALVPPLAFGQPASTWVYRALALLIVACPCALVISIPVAVVSAIGASARRGVLIKGGQVLEDLARVRAVAFDKTGTLTLGRPHVAEVFPLDGSSGEEALRLVASVESRSEHPLAGAIVRAARERGLELAPVLEFRALPGRGGAARVDGRIVWAGSPRLAEEQGVPTEALAQALERLNGRGETAVVVGEGSRALAVVALADRIRPSAVDAVRALERDGPTVMLTGDGERAARSVASGLGVREVHAGLLPEQKVEAIRELEADVGPVAMVGDGINDAPALAAATVGVAMGAAGSDVALDSADVALASDDLGKLPPTLRLARRTLRVMRENVAASLAVKAVFVTLAPLGFVSLWLAVAADMGMSLLVTLNALRLFRS